ncbi:MAG: hypothetical protein AAF434_01175 [Pseudomonadota bacterium]
MGKRLIGGIELTGIIQGAGRNAYQSEFRLPPEIGSTIPAKISDYSSSIAGNFLMGSGGAFYQGEILVLHHITCVSIGSRDGKTVRTVAEELNYWITADLVSYFSAKTASLVVTHVINASSSQYVTHQPPNSPRRSQFSQTVCAC